MARRKCIPVAVYGATGYVGAELLRLLAAHPVFAVRFVAARQARGRMLAEELPHLGAWAEGLRIQGVEEAPPEEVALAFLALPHGASAAIAARLYARGVRIVDLSADFRHPDAKEYARTYEASHPHPELLAEAVYGLAEHARKALAAARLIANPGCYPTATLLALVPLLRAGVLDPARIVVDAKSGVSGAGRAAKRELGFSEVNESLRAYGLPRHRHQVEMETQAGLLAGVRPQLRFVPHLVPMTRGMLVTIHAEGDARRWHGVLTSAYRGCPFVRVLEEGRLPATKHVLGTNRCDIGVVPLDAHTGVIVSVIDNLGKGAAGQAVQNANIAFGLAETTGLSSQALWP